MKILLCLNLVGFPMNQLNSSFFYKKTFAFCLLFCGLLSFNSHAQCTAGAASSVPIVCLNTAITNITHNTTGATGILTPTGLPAGVSATWASNTITISGTPTVAGIFNYSIPLTGGCGTINARGTIIAKSKSTTTITGSTSFCGGGKFGAQRHCNKWRWR
jgi:hypothetical protein